MEWYYRCLVALAIIAVLALVSNIVERLLGVNQDRSVPVWCEVTVATVNSVPAIMSLWAVGVIEFK